MCSQVGTLDTLMSLSDEIAKIDTFIESVVKKCEKTLLDLVDPENNDIFYVENSRSMKYII